MSIVKKIANARKRRAFRSRQTLSSHLPRVSVFRSSNHIYAQIIDDAAHKTLASCSTLELKNISGDKRARAHQIGLELARRAKELGIAAVSFDRGQFLYHGRVKALAEGLREGGLHV